MNISISGLSVSSMYLAQQAILNGATAAAHRRSRPNFDQLQPPSPNQSPSPLVEPVDPFMTCDADIGMVMAKLDSLASSSPQEVLQPLPGSPVSAAHVATRLVRVVIPLNTALMQRAPSTDGWSSDMWPEARPTQRFWGEGVLQGYVLSNAQTGMLDIVDRSYASCFA